MEANSKSSKNQEEEDEVGFQVRKSRILYQDPDVTLVRGAGQPNNDADETGRRSMTDHLRYLYEERVLLDTALINGDTWYPIHRVMLAAHSTKYTDVQPSTEIVIERPVSAEAMETLVRYLYCEEEGELTEGNIDDMLSLGAQLHLPRLVERGLRFIGTALNTNNAVHFLSLAQTPQLKQHILEFITQNFKQISTQTLDFLNIDFENLHKILQTFRQQDNRSGSDELWLLKATARWIEAQPEQRRSQAKDLIGLIRLERIPTRQLEAELELKTNLANIEEISHLLYLAYKRQALQHRRQR